MNDKQENGDKKVDLFYIYPTCNNQTSEIAEIDNYMRSQAYVTYDSGPSCMAGFTNVFAPYYRQVTITTVAKDSKKCTEAIYKSVVRTDIYASLDYYFEHYNQGRPVIFASHSQGSSVMQIVLAEYMKLHPNYYNRMVCAYKLGYNYLKSYAEAYPHVKFATGEEDTGVVIGWNSERADVPLNDWSFVVNEPGKTVPCINPLNWKTDSTPAGVGENKGTYDKTTHKVKTGVADATIRTDRNVLVVTTAPESYTECYLEGLFCHGCLHPYDWEFFYANIQENAQKRINKWFETHK